MANEHNNAPAVPQGEQATIAGLDAANGHLSTLLDDSVLMLKQLRQMVDDLHERWSNGGKPERGEFELLDRVDDWLSCRPDSMVTATAPAAPQGWKLVPVDPTEAMSIAGGIAWESSIANDVIGPLEDAWAAMLAATPAPAPAQEAAINYHPGTWYEVKSRDELEAFFLSRLPAIREAAHEHGYAIGLHGSLRRDMDVIAVPWRDGASDKDKLAHAIAMAAVGMTRNGGYEWEAKPAGRVATSLPCCWTPWHGEAGSGHIDLSVMTAPAVPQGWVEQMLTDARHVFDARGPETPQETRDVIEYVASWIAAYRDKFSATKPTAPSQEPAVPQGWRDFLTELSKQKPEKPDYWSSCGQCERNSSTAEDLLAATPDPVYVLPMSEDEITLLLADAIGFGDDELQTCNRSDLVCLVRAVEAHRSSEIGLPPSAEWISVSDRLPEGEPGDPAIEFYNNDLRNPTRQVIGVYRDGVWLSGGHQFCNVTYWKPLTPAPVCEAGGEA